MVRLVSPKYIKRIRCCVSRGGAPVRQYPYAALVSFHPIDKYKGCICCLFQTSHGEELRL